MALETRFALVMNGGVSLAIWMGGVTHELNRLRLASLGVSPPSAGEAAVHAAWAAILQATDRSVVVDAVAGTSAGGLNGTLIATAIAQGTDLPYMKTVWSEIAALERRKLLRADPDGAKSVLDGQCFASQLNDLLTRVQNSASVTGKQECTLLVTSTAIDPPATTIGLEGGESATVMDSRRVYRFARQVAADETLEIDDFAHTPQVTEDAGRPSVIAEAARASASFPVAFEPVWEDDALGKMRTQPVAGQVGTWLMDGGVLDNAPFGPLIDALRGRPIGSPFERAILYITPSPGAGLSDSAMGAAPDVARVMGRVIGAIREHDQRIDMELLTESFEQMSYTQSAPHWLMAEHLKTCLQAPAQLAVASPLTAAQANAAGNALFPSYQLTRAEAFERWIMGINRQVTLKPPSPPAIPVAKIPSMPSTITARPGTWTWGVSTAERTLRWWGRALVQLTQSVPVAPTAFTAVDRAQRDVRTVSLAQDEQLAQQIDESAGETSRLATFSEVNAQLNLDARLATAVWHAATAIVGGCATGTAYTSTEWVQYALNIEVLSSALAWGDRTEGDNPRFRYRQITPAASSMIDLGPSGAASDWPAKKLYGERWNHFGAFSTKSGREADWLWGRLDGASALCDYLFSSGEVTSAAADSLRDALADAILMAEGSDRAKIQVAAKTVYETTAQKMFHTMAAEDDADSIDLLQRTVPEVLGEIDGQVFGMPVGLLLEAATSSNFDDDDRDHASLKDRVFASVLHNGASPLRGLVHQATSMLTRRTSSVNGPAWE